MPKAKHEGLKDEDVLKVVEKIAEEEKRPVSVSRLTQEVGGYTGVFYSPDQIRTRVMRLESQGLVEVYKTLHGGCTYLFVKLKGAVFDNDEEWSVAGLAPVYRKEIRRAYHDVRVGDSFVVRVPSFGDRSEPKSVEKTVTVAKKLPHLCLFSNGKTAPWWQLALLFRRDSDHRVLDLC